MCGRKCAGAIPDMSGRSGRRRPRRLRAPGQDGYSPQMLARDSPDCRISRHLRLTTLVRLRGFAIAGQTVAVFVVGYVLGFPLAIVECAALTACSVALNIY